MNDLDTIKTMFTKAGISFEEKVFPPSDPHPHTEISVEGGCCRSIFLFEADGSFEACVVH